MKDWVWSKEASGGAIVEKNCHHYDIFNLWLESEPREVYASGGIAKHAVMSGTKSEIVDHAWVVNDYANGARAMLGICFLGAHGQKHRREFGVQGTEGRVFFSLDDGETLHLSRNDGETQTIRTDAVLRGGVFRDFLECARTGRTPLVTPEIARKSMVVPLAAEKSLEERRAVRVSEIA